MGVSALSGTPTYNDLSNKKGPPHTAFLSLFKGRTLPLPFHWPELGYIPFPDPTTGEVNRVIVIGSGKLQFTPES